MKPLIILFLLSSICFGQSPTNFGWIKSTSENSAGISRSTAKIPINNLLVNDDDEDADAYLLYRQLYLSLKEKGKLSPEELSSGRLSSLNQGQVGSCVGYGTTISLDIAACYNERMRKELRQIALARFNPDAIYAIGRAKHLGRSDGSTGSWSANGLKDIGTLHRLLYDNGVDLRTTTPQDGRKWSATGLPQGFTENAAERKLLSYELVKNTEQSKKLLKNGYPIFICAQASYPTVRDQNGFSKRSGRAWAHCMSVISYRGPKIKEGFLIQNSWGDTWNGGPIWPNDMPKGSFWVIPEDLQFHLDQNDSYAIGEYNGFPRKVISWMAVFNMDRELDKDKNNDK